MFCPRCSQQQISEETRFCSRCGFPLGLVSEILSHGGFLPQLAALVEKKKFWTRRMGMKIGVAWLLIFLLVFAPLLGLADADDAAGVAAAIGFLGAFLIMVFSWLFLEGEPKISKIEDLKLSANFTTPAPAVAGEKAQPNALPPIQNQPAQSYIPPSVATAAGAWKVPDTGDFAKPPSVTEPTTKLFKEG